MDTIKLAERVVETGQAHLWRYRQGELQAREWGTGGRKRGWSLLDLFSAGAIRAVARALNEENRARLASLPPHKAALVCFKLVK
jgi:hypothetical protein